MIEECLLSNLWKLQHAASASALRTASSLKSVASVHSGETLTGTEVNRLSIEVNQILGIFHSFSET